ncbi:MAG: DUF4255 domain-containing protein [Bacteroidota bacterium]
MLYKSLHVIVAELNAHLKTRFQLSENKAILGTILNEEGTVPEENKNKIVCTLVNLEQDTNIPFNPIYRRQGDKLLQEQVPLNFNLDVLFTALFGNYDEALKFLSATIYFFQGKSLFDHENSKGLPPQVPQLSMEVIKLSYHEAHSLWTAIGAKYMPSVLFKIRMLSYQEGIAQEVPVITEPEDNVRPNY